MFWNNLLIYHTYFLTRLAILKSLFWIICELDDVNGAVDVVLDVAIVDILDVDDERVDAVALWPRGGEDELFRMVLFDEGKCVPDVNWFDLSWTVLDLSDDVDDDIGSGLVVVEVVVLARDDSLALLKLVQYIEKSYYNIYIYIKTIIDENSFYQTKKQVKNLS